jgi:hypothetical protein
MNLAVGAGRLSDRTVIRAFQNDFARVALHPGLLQNIPEQHAGPLRVADRAELPLRLSLSAR